jgi:hypothetical protein
MTEKPTSGAKAPPFGRSCARAEALAYHHAVISDSSDVAPGRDEKGLRRDRVFFARIWAGFEWIAGGFGAGFREAGPSTKANAGPRHGGQAFGSAEERFAQDDRPFLIAQDDSLWN